MSILACGRVAATVVVTDSAAGASAHVDLVVDTGAEVSALPHASLGSVLTSATFNQPITFNVAGTTVFTLLANGPVPTVEVEPHGGGLVSTRHCFRGVRVHFLAIGSGLFSTSDGLLGMDLLDCFRADPVKDKGATRSYLATRA